MRVYNSNRNIKASPVIPYLRKADTLPGTDKHMTITYNSDGDRAAMEARRGAIRHMAEWAGLVTSLEDKVRAHAETAEKAAFWIRRVQRIFKELKIQVPSNFATIHQSGRGLLTKLDALVKQAQAIPQPQPRMVGTSKEREAAEILLEAFSETEHPLMKDHKATTCPICRARLLLVE